MKKCLQAAIDRQKKYSDMDCCDVRFKEGEEILLSTQNLKLKTVAANARKLIPKFVGPFTIREESEASGLQA